MRKFFGITAGVILLVMSCATPVLASENQFFGLLTGATLGGIVGSQFGHGGGRVAATTAGVLGGAWIGSDIGRAMDNSGATATASGRYASSAAGSVNAPAKYVPNYVAPDAPSPDSVYADAYGGTCREYSEYVRVGNQLREKYGTACLQPDGTWHAID